MNERRISRYRLLERLGEGGMGTVYRARDERLERDVAVKVLRSAVREDEEARKRFRREASALSRLSHPSINTVLDFDSENGTDFLVLELVDGKRLDQVLREGPLPADELLRIGIEMADALAAAHEEGVVHRDLKPANVMITSRGGLKLLDFGLALLAPCHTVPAETHSITEAGVVVGTIAYMAPEQLMAGSVDQRADHYALGAILFEMAAGRLPFTATAATALMNEVLHRPAPRVETFGRPVPPGFSALVAELLEKDPARRPAKAGTIVERLRAIRAQAPGEPPRKADVGGAAAPGLAAPGRIRSLVVLPLVHLSGDPEQEYFADGMTEALITDLAQIADLRVVSRTSAMRYKGTSKPLPEIARELQVDAVVEGTVARFGDRVRITAQLIDATTDRHLWARAYERDLRDVLGLQGEVAAAIAGEIRVRIEPQVQKKLSRERRVDPRAYESYLRGRYHWNRRSADGIRRGIEHFQEAIDRDPAYAPAYAGLAQAYDTLGSYSFLPPGEAFSLARAAVTRALELDESLPEAHVAWGGVLQSHLWDWPGAEAEFRRALDLDPNLAGAHHWYSDFLMAMGRSEDAIASARRAAELDPLHLAINMTLGAAYFYGRRYEEAVEQQRRTLDLDPSFAPAHRSMGGAFEQLGRYDEAIAEFRKGAALSDDLYATSLLAHAYAVSGRKEEAWVLLEELEEAEARDRFVSPYSLAAVYAGLGNANRAFELLNRAFHSRDRGMVFLYVAPRFDPLRADPRFTDLLRRMKFPGWT
ncbi:MAG TPA: protein kinase [Candidatus Eisenbacteria bacterium]|nr:protein kinase [Candidatus Eisenbacteria bacterium]